MYQKPTIYNVTLASANTEYSQDIPQNARKVLVRERSGASDVKLAFTLGQSGSNYITVAAGTTKAVDMVYLSGLTFYMQSPDPNIVIEIEVWSDK